MRLRSRAQDREPFWQCGVEIKHPGNLGNATTCANRGGKAGARRVVSYVASQPRPTCPPGLLRAMLQQCCPDTAPTMRWRHDQDAPRPRFVLLLGQAKQVSANRSIGLPGQPGLLRAFVEAMDPLSSERLERPCGQVGMVGRPACLGHLEARAQLRGVHARVELLDLHYRMKQPPGTGSQRNFAGLLAGWWWWRRWWRRSWWRRSWWRRW